MQAIGKQTCRCSYTRWSAVGYDVGNVGVWIGGGVAGKVINWDCPGCGREGRVEGSNSDEAWEKVRQEEEKHKPHLGYDRFITTEVTR